MNPLGSMSHGLISAAPPPALNRASEIFQHVIAYYNTFKADLAEDETINLVCIIGGYIYDVSQVTTRNHYLEIRALDEEENLHVIVLPVEQVAFDIIISKKKGNQTEPPREIGFKAMMDDGHLVKMEDKSATKKC